MPITAFLYVNDTDGISKHHQEGFSDKQIKTKKEDVTPVGTIKCDKMG